MWERYIARIGEVTHVYIMLVGTPRRKGRLGIQRHGLKWEDNIKADLKKYVRVCTGFIWLRVGSSG